MLFDTQTFQRIQANVNPISAAVSLSNISMVKQEQESDDDDTTRGNQQDINDILYQARTTEMEQLSQIIHRDRPTDSANEIVNILLELIGNVPESTTVVSTDAPLQTTTTTTNMDNVYVYPPLHQTGTVADRDRPYADYGHLDRPTIAREFQFNLEPRATTGETSIRLNAKSFAITAWTDVSKELLMDAIKHEFGIGNIQYICLGEEISELNHQRHLHIQIILKEKVDRRKPFLDQITQTHCNYQVTRNDRAWNEYIRKEGDYIEFGQYQSVSTRGQKQWPGSSSATSTSSLSTSDRGQITRAITTTTTRMSTRAQAEERRQLAKQALDLAETSINTAMDFIRRAMPEKFLAHSTWYVSR